MTPTPSPPPGLAAALPPPPPLIALLPLLLPLPLATPCVGPSPLAAPALRRGEPDADEWVEERDRGERPERAKDADRRCSRRGTRSACAARSRSNASMLRSTAARLGGGESTTADGEEGPPERAGVASSSESCAAAGGTVFLVTSEPDRRRLLGTSGRREPGDGDSDREGAVRRLADVSRLGLRRPDPAAAFAGEGTELDAARCPREPSRG